MGRYFPPDRASTIEDVVMDIIQQPQGDALMVVGDFTTNLVAPEGQAQDE